MENLQEIRDFVEKLIKVLKQSNHSHWQNRDRAIKVLESFLIKTPEKKPECRTLIFNILSLEFSYPLALNIAIEAATTD